MLTDDDLARFDRSVLAHGDRVDPGRLLREHGEVYRAQLVAALFFDGWRTRMREHPGALHDEKRAAGIDYALREVAAHLRMGDLLPGGVLHDETVSEKRSS